MSGLAALWIESPRTMSQWRDIKSRKLHITTKSFRFYFGRMLARLPVRLIMKYPRRNKSEVKKWIISNIPWDMKWEGLGEEVSDDSDD